MSSEIAQRARFDSIRYAQCWEDADVLTQALEPKPGGRYVSIASAGDNSFALLAFDPLRVDAIDLNPAQVFCARLRKAAYQTFEYEEFLAFLGAAPAEDRTALYQRLRGALDEQTRAYWDSETQAVRRGIIHAGKFERYFALFRRYVVPLIHSKKTVARLLEGGAPEQMSAFYSDTWENLRWRMLFHVFFSKAVMGRLGRDKEFFKYVNEPVSRRVLKRSEYAMTKLDPAQNPYMQYILTGSFGAALPFALRRENFSLIKKNIGRISFGVRSLEDYLDSIPDHSADGFNLSDIFEYMSLPAMEQVYGKLVQKAAPGARIVYWNMLAKRSRPETYKDAARELNALAGELFLRDKAFFYSAFHVDEVLP